MTIQNRLDQYRLCFRTCRSCRQEFRSATPAGAAILLDAHRPQCLGASARPGPMPVGNPNWRKPVEDLTDDEQHDLQQQDGVDLDGHPEWVHQPHDEQADEQLVAGLADVLERFDPVPPATVEAAKTMAQAFAEVEQAGEEIREQTRMRDHSELGLGGPGTAGADSARAGNPPTAEPDLVMESAAAQISAAAESARASRAERFERAVEQAESTCRSSQSGRHTFEAGMMFVPVEDVPVVIEDRSVTCSRCGLVIGRVR